MKECKETCKSKNEPCSQQNCRHFLEHEGSLNCVLICVEQNGSLTLREVSDRLNISYVRVKQIQDLAIGKIKNNISHEQV